MGIFMIMHQVANTSEDLLEVGNMNQGDNHLAPRVGGDPLPPNGDNDLPSWEINLPFKKAPTAFPKMKATPKWNTFLRLH